MLIQLGIPGQVMIADYFVKTTVESDFQSATLKVSTNCHSAILLQVHHLLFLIDVFHVSLLLRFLTLALKYQTTAAGRGCCGRT